MKKLLTAAVLFIMLTMAAITVVNAATPSTLPDELYAIGSKYGMREVDRVKMVKYLTDYPLSDSDCNKILDLAKQAEQIMIDYNTTDYKSLPEDVQAKLRALAIEAANIAGVTLGFTADGIDVYKDGVLYEVVDTTTPSNELLYTGNNINAMIGVSALAVIGMVMLAIAKRK